MAGGPQDGPVSISKSTPELSSISSSSSEVGCVAVVDDPVDLRHAKFGLSGNPPSSADSGVSEEFHGRGRRPPEADE